METSGVRACGLVVRVIGARLACAMAAIWGIADARAADAPPRPNILLIMTDDQGYGEMSCHGNQLLATPSLDRLHRESVRFTDFHVSPTCAPTRTSLMTGRHEFRSGVTHTILERERMSLKATTLAQVLQQSGYRTGIFGKWHLGDEDAYQPERRGFDEVFIHGAGGIGQTYAGSCGDAPGNTYFDPAILHNGKFEKTKGFCTDVFFGQATQWIDRQRHEPQPWFAYVTPNAPHGPYHCPPEYAERFKDKGLDKDAIGYYGMIANIDDNLGRLLDQLQRWDLDRQTLVIFMTDNGHAISNVYNAGMRGAKGTPYQGGTRVPSFWRWPGKFAAGADITKLAAHVDILPTLAEIAGAKLPASPTLDGRSLMPLLKDAQADWADRFLFTHVGRWEKGRAEQAKFSNCAVRTARFRLVNNRELFDILADPGETTNVIDKHPDAVAEMRRAYDAWWNEILPALENENAVGPAVNSFKARYWKQFGGGPDKSEKEPKSTDRPKPSAKDAKNGAAANASRPNIMWLTSEDHGPHMGCYGDRYATTPNVDALARRGLTFRHVWSNAPVCAPARTTLVSGLYPPSTGAEHMRSMVPMPSGTQMYPQLLRAAGYYCTNNAKEDYNLAPVGRVWDVSSKQAHWKHRPAGQPFMAVFNSEQSHESKIRARPHHAMHDPAEVRVPSYHPDTPEVRQDWAQYYDQVSAADADAGTRLAELEAAGLADDTIVFYFADHGSGMPRHKRWLYDSGLHVPLIVHVPEKFRHLAPTEYRPGGTTDQVVSFIDFAPTLVSLAGVRPPEWMQGHAFMGEFRSPPHAYAFGFRARMDERYDLSRSVTDGRFVYIRNYMPHKTYGQHVSYMFQTPTTQVWESMHIEGKLTSAQDAFWNRKPYAELYDLESDPDETKNLTESTEHQETRQRLAEALDYWEQEIRDVTFLPEGEMHRRANGKSPRDMALDDKTYPFAGIYGTAQLASRLEAAAIPALRARLIDADQDAAVRYWAALGLAMRGADAVQQCCNELRRALDDPAPDVRIVAAEALARHGASADVEMALDRLAKLGDWTDHDGFTALAALNALDALGPTAKSQWPQLVQLPTAGEVSHPRYREYVPRLIQRFEAVSDTKSKPSLR